MAGGEKTSKQFSRTSAAKAGRAKKIEQKQTNRGSALQQQTTTADAGVSAPSSAFASGSTQESIHMQSIPYQQQQQQHHAQRNALFRPNLNKAAHSSATAATTAISNSNANASGAASNRYANHSAAAAVQAFDVFEDSELEESGEEGEGSLSNNSTSDSGSDFE